MYAPWNKMWHEQVMNYKWFKSLQFHKKGIGIESEKSMQTSYGSSGMERSLR